MIRNLFRLGVIGALASAALIPVVASASGMTVSLPASAQLSAKVALTIPVTVTCPAFNPSLESQGLTLVQERVGVSVEQASNKAIARGTGEIDWNPGSFPFACDGGTATIAITVVADPTGPPFSNARAYVSAFAQAVGGIPFPSGGFYCPYPTGCVEQDGSTSAVVTVKH